MSVGAQQHAGVTQQQLTLVDDDAASKDRPLVVATGTAAVGGRAAHDQAQGQGGSRYRGERGGGPRGQ